MSHPRRARAARELRKLHPELDLRIVTDPRPDEPPSTLRTAQPAWQAVCPDATHHLVLQDDAVLCQDFADRVRELVLAHPDRALCLFTEWGSLSADAVRLAALGGSALAPVVDEYLPCVALVLPAEHARGFAEFAATKATDEDPDDVVLLAYAQSAGLDALVPVAGPTEHSNPVSLAGNDGLGPRSAVCFADDLPVPAHATGPVMELPEAIPHFCWREQRAVVLVRDGDHPAGWREPPARQLLEEEWGVPQNIVSASLRRALRDDPRRDLLHDRISSVLLGELWTTAWAMGHVVTGAGRSLRAADSTVARAALATLAAGGLRRVLPAQWLRPLGEALGSLLLRAVREGGDR
ncbi:hypothetical protein [Streptomyces sp. NPDC058398]|uniref:hypothetical protein n=1 Tax=Streptomyces sp. NPDC058398 TaxID=3346479 RepID=UPI00364A2DEB